MFQGFLRITSLRFIMQYFFWNCDYEFVLCWKNYDAKSRFPVEKDPQLYIIWWAPHQFKFLPLNYPLSFFLVQVFFLIFLVQRGRSAKTEHLRGGKSFWQGNTRLCGDRLLNILKIFVNNMLHNFSNPAPSSQYYWPSDTKYQLISAHVDPYLKTIFGDLEWFGDVLGQKRAVLVGTWWYWVSKGQYWMIVSGTGSVKGGTGW